MIRVWPGQMLRTAELTPEGYAAMVSDAQRICDELELYMQKYCGCVFSEEDRYCKKKK